MNEIVIDASIVIAFVLIKEEDHANAIAFIRALAKRGTRLCTPILWESEIDSAIRRQEHTGKITLEMGDAAFTVIDDLCVEVIYLPQFDNAPEIWDGN